jgi:hypothetical protein
MEEASNKKHVAIACQGGGSHTAFTAGVLGRLLRAQELAGYEVVGLSGTSGGAVCALLTWHRLLRGEVESGVSGGVLAVVPGKLGIGVFSPGLDAYGNSVKGTAVCEEVSERLGLHVFANAGEDALLGPGR